MLRSSGIITIALAFAAFASGTDAQAQIDPSSAVLLDKGGRSVNRDTGLDSGRYTVRPKSESTVRREEVPVVKPPRKAQGDGEESAPPTSATVVVVESGGRQPAPREEEKLLPPPQPQQVIVGPPAPPREPTRKLNLLEIDVAPVFIYNNSDSSYFFRNYNQATPGFDVHARVWTHPTFAMQFSFMQSLSGHINDSVGGARNVPATQQWLTAGVRHRKFFGASALAPLLLFGLDFYEYGFKVPSDSIYRASLKSIGALVTVEADMPVTAKRSWTLSVFVGPKLQHTEAPNVTDFKSGGNVETNLVGASLGGRFQFEREDAIFWKLTHRLEKSLFTGDASVADPARGGTPAGVSVTNSFTIFELGYSWGN